MLWKRYVVILFSISSLYVILKYLKSDKISEESISSAIPKSAVVSLSLTDEDDTTEAKKSVAEVGLITEDKFSGWKKILFWTDFQYSPVPWEKIFLFRTSDTIGGCEEKRCRFTMNRMEITNVDAVLFNAYNLRNLEGLEEELVNHVFPLPFDMTRNSDQLYIFYSMEPPTKMDISYLRSIPKNYFNWTMGYRRDADVYEPFGIVKRQESLQREKLRRLNKSDLLLKNFAIFIGSSCWKNSTTLRDRFLLQLKREIKIDIYGQCGNLCDDVPVLKLYGMQIGQANCEKIIKNYIFYLALENSFCKDYVTEKIFKAWTLGAIPVVFGAGNYTSFAPPKSYIDSRDFDSVTDLANYMKKVATDPDLYNQYFKWKADYEVEVGSPYRPFICDLCKKLNKHSSSNSPRKWYPDIYDWFVRKSDCKSPDII